MSWLVSWMCTGLSQITDLWHHTWHTSHWFEKTPVERHWRQVLVCKNELLVQAAPQTSCLKHSKTVLMLGRVIDLLSGVSCQSWWSLRKLANTCTMVTYACWLFFSVGTKMLWGGCLVLVFQDGLGDGELPCQITTSSNSIVKHGDAGLIQRGIWNTWESLPGMGIGSLTLRACMFEKCFLLGWIVFQLILRHHWLTETESPATTSPSPRHEHGTCIA